VREREIVCVYVWCVLSLHTLYSHMHRNTGTDTEAQTYDCT
jgi:hypothetical protein